MWEKEEINQFLCIPRMKVKWRAGRSRISDWRWLHGRSAGCALRFIILFLVHPFIRYLDMQWFTIVVLFQVEFSIKIIELNHYTTSYLSWIPVSHLVLVQFLLLWLLFELRLYERIRSVINHVVQVKIPESEGSNYFVLYRMTPWVVQLLRRPKLVYRAKHHFEHQKICDVGRKPAITEFWGLQITWHRSYCWKKIMVRVTHSTNIFPPP